MIILSNRSIRMNYSPVCGALLRRVNKEQLTPVMHIEFGDVRASISQKWRFHKGVVFPFPLAAKEAGIAGASLSIIVDKSFRVKAFSKTFGRGSRFITERTVDVHVGMAPAEA